MPNIDNGDLINNDYREGRENPLSIFAQFESNNHEQHSFLPRRNPTRTAGHRTQPEDVEEDSGRTQARSPNSVPSIFGARSTNWSESEDLKFISSQFPRRRGEE